MPRRMLAANKVYTTSLWDFLNPNNTDFVYPAKKGGAYFKCNTTVYLGRKSFIVVNADPDTIRQYAKDKLNVEVEVRELENVFLLKIVKVSPRVEDTRPRPVDLALKEIEQRVQKEKEELKKEAEAWTTDDPILLQLVHLLKSFEELKEKFYAARGGRNEWGTERWRISQQLAKIWDEIFWLVKSLDFSTFQKLPRLYRLKLAYRWVSLKNTCPMCGAEGKYDYDYWSSRHNTESSTTFRCPNCHFRVSEDELRW